MALKLKVNSAAEDIKRFAGLITDRERAIKAAPEDEINPVFRINEIAKEYHPDYQKMVIDEIIDHEGADAKTFSFRKADGSKAAFFRAGQYVSVLLQIDGSLVTRPYSICSSPLEAKNGIVKITVRNVKDGYAAPYMLQNFKVGDEVIISGPEGTFYYEPLRDAENVIALAGGSGITPFLSMASAIRDGLEDFNLTILFGSRTEENILFKDELDGIAKACDKVKIVHVLSDEKKKKGFESGFINAKLIKKYAPQDGNYSIFICGPEAMYRFAEKEIATLGIEKKYIRRELLGVTKNVSALPGYPEEAKGKTFNLKVIVGPDEYEVTANADESVLTAIERAGIPAPSRCRSGECGWCRSKLVCGTVYVPEETDGRKFTDKEFNYIHPCASFPTSDLTVSVPGSYMKK